MEKEKHKFTNSLIDESSPYLLQHAHNPVNWMPWGDEAFEKAKKEDKLVLVSIGYSSCHWCHVMEHESFENEAVAEIMNKNFVCIKVDREERPDVDQVYMTAVQLMTNQGGWPLNCFTLSDGRPVFGGTYFSKNKWIDVLDKLQQSYVNDKSKVIEYADNLTQGIQTSELITVKEEAKAFKTEKLDELVSKWTASFDNMKGGPNRAPKFPLPNNYDFLMQYAYQTNNVEVMNHVDLTLQKMAFGGIYDQVGGGFARYSTDEAWRVPHFEKMLYDNAQLVSLYSHAYQRTKNPLYKEIVYQTLEWVDREMTTKYGSFYSALDADSEGEEGKYYVWTKEELKSTLKDDYDFVKEYYNINSYGLWEGNYILTRDKADSLFYESMGKEEFRAKVDKINLKLLLKRAKRERPGLDDKSLTAWNAMMTVGYLDAYQAFGDETFFKQAMDNKDWLEKNQIEKDFKLLHTFKNGKSKIDGFLDDYSSVIEMYIKLYEVTFDEAYLDQATGLTEYTIKHFEDEQSGMFFFTSDESSDLVARKMELSDNVIPASNSIMAKNLMKLGVLLDNADYTSKSKQMLANVYDEMHTYGSAYSNWGLLCLSLSESYYEVAITGDGYSDLLNQMNKMYLPNKIVMGGNEPSKLPLLEGKFVGETTIFVCVDKACQMPVNNISDAIKQMK
ncbi:MAG: thioredoxin domain-containing protein [Crocinitomix sp. MedPE-SWsnd]|nr:MAG: thioredoxin domain-containing protein [Crocinitomix sp. MedPE-SWsnd]